MHHVLRLDRGQRLARQRAGGKWAIPYSERMNTRDLV